MCGWVGPSLSLSLSFKIERVENNLIKVKVYLKNTKVEYIEKLMCTFNLELVGGISKLELIIL